MKRETKIKSTVNDLDKNGLFCGNNRKNISREISKTESVISDRKPQFVAELTKELNKILGIKMKLLISFHLQTDRQTKYMNQELEQYLRLFIDHKQKN